jgi:hypothetical protein
MSFPFSGQRGLILVSARVTGPLGSANAKLALDTAALTTWVDPRVLASVGYDSAIATQYAQVLTASGLIRAPLQTIDSLTALGKTRILMPVVTAALDPASNIDGLLGLDFLRGTRLTVDFAAGQVDLQ